MKRVSALQVSPPPHFSWMTVDGRDYFPVVDYVAVEHAPPSADPPPGSPTTRRERYMLTLVCEGDGEIMHENALVPVSPGTVIFSSPGNCRSLQARTREGITFRVMLFSYFTEAREQLELPIHELLPMVAGEPLRQPGVSCQASPLTTRGLINAFDGLLQQWRQEPIPWLPMHRRFHDYLLQVIEQVLLPDAYGPSVPPGLLAVKAEIDRHFHQSLNLAELAAMAELTPNYLCRRFKECFGQPPRDYQMSLQMRQAQSLLSQSNMRINEVARNVGFYSSQYFARLFKERTGMTPSEYRAAAS